MNLTESQIKALPIVDKQKLAIELREVKTSDRAYPQAKALLDVILSDKKYKEPDRVKATATTDISVDGREVKEGQTVDLLPWQYTALARFFELAGKAAAMIALLFACMTSFGQQTYTVTTLLSLSNATNTPALTNYIAGTTGSTSNYLAAAVITTNTIISPSVITSNGTQYVSYTTNSTTTTNYPCTINLARWGQAAILMMCNLAATASTNGNVQSQWDVSLDGLNWITNAFQLTCTSSGANYVGAWTNLTYLGAAGYIRLDQCVNNNTQAVTNIIIQVAKKPILQGP
jgi:hypothetical protein